MRFKRTVIFFILASCSVLPAFVFAATEEVDAAAEAQPVHVIPADMPLALYRSLKSKLSQQPLLRAEVHAQEETIVRALTSPQALQRILAAQVLHQAADKKQAVAALVDALKNDGDAEVRAAAANALGRLNDSAAVESLMNALHDENENVRVMSAAALGLLRDERASGALLRVLGTESQPLLRLQAAVALAGIKKGFSEKELADVLRAEPDERVKMAIVGAIKTLSNDPAAKPLEIADSDDYGSRLTELAVNMKDVEGKLREDRHDEAVQFDGKNIEDKLSDLIRELEKMKQQSQSESSNSQSKQKGRKQLAAGRQGGQPRGGGKGPGSADSAINAPEVVGRSERWASLPVKERDELLQIYRPEVPIRWRKRLEAYFISIAAEEAKAK